MAPTAITPVTAVPAVAPDDVSLAGAVFCPDGGNAIEIFGHVDNGDGKLYLLRHLTGTTEWYPVDIDASDSKALLVDATLPAAMPGYFSGTWMAGDLRGSARAYYVVLSDGGADLDKLYAAGRRV